MTVADVAGLLHVSAATVRWYSNTGVLKCYRRKSGHRYFLQEDVDDYLGVRDYGDMVFYVRSSSGDKVLMESQVRQLEIAYGKPARVFKDTSSGLNENRRGLQSLINNARKRTISTICITNKDRLTRFGYTYLQELLNGYGVTIQVLHENDDKPLQEELMNDFMNLIASFSGRFYRIRGHEQQKKLLTEAQERINGKTH